MVIQVDAKIFELSVSDLTEQPLFSAIGQDRGQRLIRLSEGAELHQRKLADRKKNNELYQAEVFVRDERQLQGWTFRISGRIDGCHPASKGWAIEEFKSAIFLGGEHHPSRESVRKHQQQALNYALFWRKAGNTISEVSVIYVDVLTDREQRITIPFQENIQNEFVDRRLSEILQQWQEEENWRIFRRAEAERILFPHSETRLGQAQLMSTVTSSFQAGRILFAEAPTGIGKTAAAIFPSLQFALKNDRTLVFLTSKNLQQEMALKVTRTINSGRKLNVIQLRSKEKMCANGKVFCHEDVCRFARNFPEKMVSRDVLGKLKATQNEMTPDLIFDHCNKNEVCPFEVQLILARKADVLIGDYNYLFDPGSALTNLDREVLGQVVVLVDEAHNLPDRGRQIYSSQLSELQLRAALKSIGRQPGDLFDSLASVVNQWIEELHGLASSLGNNTIGEAQPDLHHFQLLCVDWQHIFARYCEWKKQLLVAPGEDELVNLHFALQQIYYSTLHYGPEFRTTIELTESGVLLNMVCLDPSRLFRPLFSSAGNVLLMSATLSPIESLTRALGVDEHNISRLHLPPPFPRENRKILIHPGLRTDYVSRKDSMKGLAKLIAGSCDAAPGNKLVLFPSYTYLAQCSAMMPAMNSELLLQIGKATPEERGVIFRAMSEKTDKGRVLFAVLGGIYSEGVDFGANAISMVVVISPGLPQLNFYRKLLREYFEEKENAGFEYAFLHPGMRKVVQAVGRLIRN
ncbi:MAG: ATP-dependent helicase DinG, partial [Verrucomicrobiales bacterium]|nr:ATP-dependent helicase DinG [Verrucomicrobiales bacterium]